MDSTGVKKQKMVNFICTTFLGVDFGVNRKIVEKLCR